MIASREYVKDLICKVLKSIGFKKEFNKYSTEEQIIGTWIDGKPLYRKYFKFDGHEYNDSNKLYPVPIDNIDTVVRFNTYLDRKYTTTARYIQTTNIGTSNNNSYNICIIYEQMSNKIMVNKGSSITKAYYPEFYVNCFMEYTKTTD